MTKNILLWCGVTHIDADKTLEDQFAQSGNNFGNLLIGQGALRLFPDGIAQDRAAFNSVDEINEICSHVVIPAANLLWHGFDAGFMLDTIQRLSIPVVIIGLGAQSSNRNVLPPLNPATVRVIREIADRSNLLGVRGYYTAEILASLGIHNVSVVGCPSVYLNRAPFKSESEIAKPSLASPSINCSRRVNSHSFNPAVSQLIESALVQIAINNDGFFVAQDEIEELSLENADQRISDPIKKYYHGIPSEELIKFFRERSTYFSDLAKWSAFLSKRSSSLGTRFHGNLLSVLSGTAALFVPHDSRTLELCSLLGVPSVNVAELDAQSISSAWLTETIQSLDYSLFCRTQRALFKRMNDFLAQNGLPSALET